MNRNRVALQIGSVSGGAAWRCLALLLALSALCASQALIAQPQPDLTYMQAYDLGYQEGLQQGRLDKRGGKGFEPKGKNAHEKADSGFDPKLHHQDIYYQGYRRGFEDGYEEGYGISTPPNRPPEPSPAPRPVRRPPGKTAPPPPGINSSSGEQILLPVGLILQVSLLDPLSTRKNGRGDPFRAEVIQDVILASRLAVPGGTPVHGIIRYLRRAGRIRGKSEMRLRFDEVRFQDGRRVPIAASVIALRERPNSVKDGEGTIEAEGSKGDDGKAVAASSAIGAVIGVLSGGKTGGVIGAGAGAVIGLGGVLGTRGKDVDLPIGTVLIIRLDRQAVISLPGPLIPTGGSASRND
ncbi:MAG: hypothetical protein V3T83_22495 [Acidobacteriota bacterium]